MRTLCFVLGDQLSPDISALRGADPSRDVVLMVEVAEEAVYAAHHKKKLAFILAAMRAFADELRGLGWTVDYVPMDAPDNGGSFGAELARAMARHRPGRVALTEASEWRVRQMQAGWCERYGSLMDLRPDDRFICGIDEFGRWAKGRKQLRLEHFYREMRRKTGLLMEGDKPAGGRWNFDTENRKPARADLFMPMPVRVPPSDTTRAVLDMVAARFAENFGTLEPFWFPVTRTDAARAVDHFLRHALPHFGDFQDAMLRGEPFLHHSLLSPLINVGLVDPLDLCRRAEAEYRAGRAPINAVEGFVRQIIGWREYVRGIYWLGMPGYTERNALNAHRPLPALYWSGETDMACMAEAIGQTQTHAYAHHIQRLMVTGNFALIAGIDPHALHSWYLAVYLDAFEWVEAPNTIGMSQYADGGWLASKPYAASGAYIDRMSDYCGGCRYRVKEKVGPDACPFNALYWHFLARHRNRFAGNPRMAQMYRTYDRFTEAHRAALNDQADRFLAYLSHQGTDRGWRG
ncbi:cryptochrome/photolyase family protein [Sphingomonas sp.]|uniref:cryptochrome/photolyase family protein n=1 Tax=Sphingomonas sp. TaxID=28214 RepID=UPI001D6A89C6|nr:cryptochrome/photolyase family protein [Sphingomonas sp.]MBX9795439.1 cryptochrome/photolyase family protein [Sphingomonas sp.]